MFSCSNRKQLSLTLPSAFGVILLEIGLWKTPKDAGVRVSGRDHRKLSSSVHASLVAIAAKLRYYMGERYEEIVLKCLKGEVLAFGIQATESSDDSRLQRAFREQVVEVLALAAQNV